MTQLLGWIATILFTICYIPQIVKISRSKKIDGVSETFFVIQCIANSVALIYAIQIGQWPLEVKYVLGILFVSAVLFVYSKNRG